jgi:hypothetical protein
VAVNQSGSAEALCFLSVPGQCCSLANSISPDGFPFAEPSPLRSSSVDAVSIQIIELIRYMRQWNSKPPESEQHCVMTTAFVGVFSSEEVPNRSPPVPNWSPTTTVAGEGP